MFDWLRRRREEKRRREEEAQRRRVWFQTEIEEPLQKRRAEDVGPAILPWESIVHAPRSDMSPSWSAPASKSDDCAPSTSYDSGNSTSSDGGSCGGDSGGGGGGD